MKRPSIRLDEKLWQAIAAHSFNAGPAVLSFEQRLGRENRWSAAYTARAIREYRRFLYLAVRAGHPVTPSDEVDQVWHLHLVYTRNYWDELCGKVLGQPLHHGPTEGGPDEAAKYTDWYAKTLTAYRAHFGEAPPRDIWPATEDRFVNSDRYQRVDTHVNWEIAKPRIGMVTAVALPFMALGLGGATAAGSGAQFSALSISFLGALLATVILLATGFRRGAIWFSVMMPLVFAVFHGPELIAAPKLIFAGCAIWVLVSLLVFAIFYRKRRRGDGSSSGDGGGGCSSGCYTYSSGQSDGSAGGDSGGGSDGGGSGCGGGCGGGGD